jgi:hypothetical protein
VSLDRNTEFTTDDPVTLRSELRQAWRALVSEIAAIGKSAPLWTMTVVPAGSSVGAQPNYCYAGYGFNVYAPGNPRPGDVFRVLYKGGGGGINVYSSDGSLVNGAAPPSTLSSAGFLEYQWVDSVTDAALRGWWSNAP